MTNNFELKGEWFLPINREKRVHGVLRYSPEEVIELELYGNLQSDNFFSELKNEEIILGTTTEGDQVTILNCVVNQYTARLIYNGELGKTKTIYLAEYFLVGTHSDKIENLKFTQIKSEIFNLGQWVGIRGFSDSYPSTSKDKEIIVKYKLPEPVEFDIDDNTKGIFNFSVTQSEVIHHRKNFNISEKVEFQVVSTIEKSIDDLLSYIRKFQNFLILSLYKNTYILSVSLSGDRYKNDYGNANIYNKKIKLYFYSRNIKLNEKTQIAQQMGFDYLRIKNNFPTIIKNWYSEYELLESAFNLFFAQFYNDNTFIINTFLNLAQSAETFHRIKHNKKKILKEDDLKIQKYLLSVVKEEEYKKWLQHKFKLGNNLTLDDRLTEITEKYSNKILDKILFDKKKFVIDVKNSRHYYTHYSKKNKKKALEGKELFYLAEKLKIILAYAFLSEIGFSKEDLDLYLERIQHKIV